MSENRDKAEKLVRQHARWSLVAGLMPVPGLDIAAVAATQVRMLSKLAEAYGVPFSEHRGKSLILALLGSLLSKDFASGGAASLIKAVPVVGVALGAVAMPVISAASTQATGKVFIHHFESGGTLLDFSPATARDYAKAQYNEALEVWKRRKEGAAEEATAPKKRARGEAAAAA